MRRTARHIITLFLPVAFALGLAFLLASARPAVAEPVSVTPLPPVTDVDGFAGVCNAQYYGPGNRPFLPLAYNAGARHDRVDFRWDTIAAKGYEEGYDPLVDDELAAGIDLIGILWATPENFRKPGCDPAVGLEAGAGVLPGQRPPGWYAPETGGLSSFALTVSDAGACPPAGLYNSWTTGDFNGNHWAKFVYDTVYRYRDRVKYWEMWNEAEWSWFWLGSDAEYAQLLKVGYQATKAACPDCTVLFAGLHYWADPTFFERVLDIVNDDSTAPGNNYFFDVMSVHFYSRSSNAYDMVNHVRNRMGLYVPDHPIWLTETGVPVWDDDSVDPDPTKYDYAATQDEAAAYVIQSYANAWASGVGQYFFFRVHDHDMSEYFGLIRNDQTLRPAYVAYQVATTYLISPTFVTRAPTGSHLGVTLWGTPRGKVSVLWNESPVAGIYTLTAVLSSATRVDRCGVTTTIAATGGVYTFTLPGATATSPRGGTANRPSPNQNDYIIGGDPLIVIESEVSNEPPTSTVHSLPTVTYSPTVRLTWEGQDNQSGVWYYDVQVRDGGGEWDYWLHSTTSTSDQFTGEHGHTYYFRSRATDNVGNREVWPEEPYVHTTLDLSSTLHLSIGALFADEDHDGIWDKPITATNEITLTDVTLRFLDEAGHDVVSSTVGSSWEFTTIIYAGQTYQLRADSTDHMRILSFIWLRGGEVYPKTYPVLGMWPVTRSYLPLVLRDG